MNNAPLVRFYGLVLWESSLQTQLILSLNISKKYAMTQSCMFNWLAKNQWIAVFYEFFEMREDDMHYNSSLCLKDMNLDEIRRVRQSLKLDILRKLKAGEGSAHGACQYHFYVVRLFMSRNRKIF